MEDLVPEERILISQTVIFDDYDEENNKFSMRELSEEDSFRFVVFMDKHVIDIETGNLISELKYRDGLICGEVRLNTMYFLELYKTGKYLTDEKYQQAQDAYRYYLKQKELIEAGKLKRFKAKRLF